MANFEFDADLFTTRRNEVVCALRERLADTSRPMDAGKANDIAYWVEFLSDPKKAHIWLDPLRVNIVNRLLQ